MQANIAWGSCHFHLNNKKKWEICPRKLITPSGKKKWPKHELLRDLWHYPLHWLENVRHIPSNPYHNLAKGNVPPAHSSSCSAVDQELRYFAVIRNPYERAISAYYYQAEFKHKTKLHRKFFMNKWIYKHCLEYRNKTNTNDDSSSSSIGSETVHYIPQYEYIFDTHGQRRVHHILHFENLTHEFNDLMAKYNLNITLLDTKTKSSVTVKEDKRFGPQDLYPKVRTILEELYVNDFALGNYSFMTKVERKKALVANYEPPKLAIASSNSKTNTEISLVKERIINETKSKKSHVGKRKSSELEPDDEIVPNPPTAKMQKQKRRQPSAIGAPTTKLNKTASRESKRVKAK
jgi:hypothetical protein